MHRYILCMFIFVLSLGACSGDQTTGIANPPQKPEDPKEPELPERAGIRTYYVSASTGNDARTPAQAKEASTPWKTIQTAMNTIVGGDTLVILSGNYHERVTITSRCSGTEETPTVIVGNTDQSVIIDDRKDGVTERWTSVFKINGARHIYLKGIKVQNGAWYGFSVEGNSEYITIDSCFTYNTRASGIYGAYVSHFTVTNNNIRKACQERERGPNNNGSQECITITRTNDFLISRNEVWDSEVDGTSGGEGIDAKGASYGGEISHNYIHDIIPLGIYVDAGSGESHDIRVFGNKLVNTGGLSVAGELGGHARDIYFYNNVVVNSMLSGFVFQNIQNGQFTNIYIVNNTFYNSNRTGGFGGDVANYSKNTENRNLVIRYNIFYNRLGKSRFSIWHDVAAPHVIGNNLFYDFKAGIAGGENNYDASKLTAADIVGQDPLFADETIFDLELRSTSPAIDRASPVTLPGSETLMFDTDFNGKKRMAANWDMGAFEY